MNYVIAFILLAAVGASKATKEAPATSLCVSNTGPATDGEYVQVPVAEGSYITEQYSRGALSLFRTNTGYVEAPHILLVPPPYSSSRSQALAGVCRRGRNAEGHCLGVCACSCALPRHPFSRTHTICTPSTSILVLFQTVHHLCKLYSFLPLLTLLFHSHPT